MRLRSMTSPAQVVQDTTSPVSPQSKSVIPSTFTQNLKISSTATNADLTAHGGDEIDDGRSRGRPKTDVNDFLLNSISDDSVAVLDLPALSSSFLILPCASQSQKYSSCSTSSPSQPSDAITPTSTPTSTSSGHGIVACPAHLSESIPISSQNSLSKPDNCTDSPCHVSGDLNPNCQFKAVDPIRLTPLAQESTRASPPLSHPKDCQFKPRTSDIHFPGSRIITSTTNSSSIASQADETFTSINSPSVDIRTSKTYPRQGGTASVRDLASLVRISKQKAARNQSIQNDFLLPTSKKSQIQKPWSQPSSHPFSSPLLRPAVNKPAGKVFGNRRTSEELFLSSDFDDDSDAEICGHDLTMNSGVSQLEGKLLKSARCRSISLNSLTNTTFQPGVPSPGLSELTSFHKNFPHTSEAKLKAAENRAYCSDRTDLENQAQPSLSAGFRDQARLLTRRSSSGSDQKLRLPILSNFQRTRADPIQEKKKLKYQDQSCPMSPRSQSEVGERTSTSQSDGSQGLSKEQCTSLLNFHPQPYSKVSSWTAQKMKKTSGYFKRKLSSAHSHNVSHSSSFEQLPPVPPLPSPLSLPIEIAHLAQDCNPKANKTLNSSIEQGGGDCPEFSDVASDVEPPPSQVDSSSSCRTVRLDQDAIQDDLQIECDRRCASTTTTNQQPGGVDSTSDKRPSVMGSFPSSSSCSTSPRLLPSSTLSHPTRLSSSMSQPVPSQNLPGEKYLLHCSNPDSNLTALPVSTAGNETLINRMGTLNVGDGREAKHPLLSETSPRDPRASALLDSALIPPRSGLTAMHQSASDRGVSDSTTSSSKGSETGDQIIPNPSKLIEKNLSTLTSPRDKPTSPCGLPHYTSEPPLSGNLKTSHIFNSLPAIRAQPRKKSSTATTVPINSITKNLHLRDASDNRLTRSPSPMQSQSSTHADQPSSLQWSRSHHPHDIGMAEEEKLRLSLEHWQLDSDGVLSSGSNSKQSPNLPLTSLPQTLPSASLTSIHLHSQSLPRSSSQSTTASFFSTSSEIGQHTLRTIHHLSGSEKGSGNSLPEHQPFFRKPVASMVNGSSPISHSQNAPGRVSPAQLYHKSSGSFSSSIPNLVNPERLESHHISSNSDIPQSVIRISSESKPSDVTQTSSRGQSSALLFSHSAPISSSSSLPNASHSSVSSGPALSSSLFSPPHLAWSHGLPLAFKNACAQPNPAVGRNRSLTEDSSSSSLKTLNNYSPRIMNYASPSPSQSFRSPYISTYSESNCRRLSPSPRNSLARLTDQDREEPESRLRSTPSIRLVASSNSVGGYNQDMLHHHTTNQTSGFMSANSSPRLASTLSFGPSPASSSSPLFFNRPRPDLNHMIHLNPTNTKTSSFPPSPNLRGSPLSGTYNELCKSHKSEKIASTGLGLGLSIAGRSDSQKSSLSEEGQVGRDDEQHSKKLCHKISDINDSTGSRSSSTVSGLAILHMDLNSGRARQSIDSNSHTTASTPEPSLQVYKPDSTLSVHSLSHAQDSVMIDHSLSISENASKLAALFWDDDERLIKKDKLMEWLGGLESQSNQALNKLKSLTLKEYMAKFDFEGLRIDMGLRKLCTKLYIKGETQQVDRILAEFSKRFWDQNRTNLYFNTDMVHALSYSMLLLNTDLHVVDYHSRMSRSQFIKNTLETVYAQLPENLDDGSLLSSRDDDGGYQKASGGESNITSGESNEQGIPARASFENGIRRRRNSLADWSVRSNAPPARSSLDRWKEVFGRHNDAMDPQQSTFANYWSGNITSAENDSYSFAKSNLPHGGVSPQSVISTSRIPGLESSATTMSSDRDCPIEGVKGMKAVDDAINVVSSSSTSVSTTNSASYFSGGEQGRLEVEDSDRGRRRGSCFNMVENFSRSQFDKEIEVLLKDVYVSIKSQPIFNSARSDSPLRPGIQNSITLQRASSRRSPHSMLSSDRSGSGAGAGSKRASFRGLGGLLFAGPEISTGATRSISPTPSVGSTTQSACSMASGPQGYASTTGSHALTSLTTPSIGFVSNLSQSIIKELQEEESDENKDDTDQLGDDYEELALLGPPWAKEGILQRKQYWSSKGKRHKDKSWIQVFVVIAKGSLKMFRFGESSLGVGQSGGGSHIGEGDCQPPSDQARVGGGNWLVNAQIIGELSLSHSLTSALPSGYSKERPFAFVMTLSSGASYFFQAGTEELVNEWVSTCNYWSARLSKEPLTGGVSNMEYGWNQISDLDVAINAAGRNSSRGLIVKEKSHSPNKASQADSQDQEEMMSIMSGNSGHSHKSRKLRSRFFNGSNHSGHHHRHFLPPLPTLSPQSVSDGKRELNLSGLRPEDASDLNSPEEVTSEIKTRIPEFSPPALQCESIAAPTTPTSIQTFSSSFTQQFKNINVDKVTICDWNPPVPPLATSRLSEVEQLESLKKHNLFLRRELEKHNQLRRPMIDLFRNRPLNLQKSKLNWEKKSQYLLTEIIKYSTYIDRLEESVRLRREIHLERRANFEEAKE